MNLFKLHFENTVHFTHKKKNRRPLAVSVWKFEYSNHAKFNVEFLKIGHKFGYFNGIFFFGYIFLGIIEFSRQNYDLQGYVWVGVCVKESERDAQPTGGEKISGKWISITLSTSRKCATLIRAHNLIINECWMCCNWHIIAMCVNQNSDSITFS